MSFEPAGSTRRERRGNTIRTWLDTVLPPHHHDEVYLEARIIADSKGIISQDFFDHSNREPFVNRCLDYGLNNHVFASLQPREVRSGKNSDIARAVGLAVDLDAKDFENGRADIEETLEAFALEPTCLVNSGNGYHAYFCLKEPFAIPEGSDARANFQEDLRAIHAALGADDTYDIARVWRVPGTLNVKDPDNPTWCRLDAVSGRRYTLDDIRLHLPDLEDEHVSMTDQSGSTPGTPDIGPDGPLDVESIDEDILDSVDEALLERARRIPDHLDGDRSRNDFAIATALIEAGYDESDIFKLFATFADRGWAAGSKYAQQGDDYLKHTVFNARRTAETNGSSDERTATDDRTGETIDYSVFGR